MISQPTLQGGQPVAGEIDNRLSLDPNDDRWPQVLDWEDGMEYTLSNVRLRQVSAGEFEVMSVDSDGTAGGGGEAALPQSPLRQLGNTGRAGQPNPALEAVISANR